MKQQQAIPMLSVRANGVRSRSSKAHARAGESVRTQPPPSNHVLLRRPAGLLQTKLTIGKPNDAFEQEADRVADQVMRMPASTQEGSTTALNASNHGVQRKCACGGTPGPTGECKACQKKRLSLQRRATSSNATAEVPPIVHEVLRSQGQPLDSGTRAFMEPRFGQDFDSVRVHADGRAAKSARAVSALAYTVGNNIVFGAGEFAPGTREGRRLLAHELAHTLQQERGIRRDVIQKRSGCSTAQDSTIDDDHARARGMLSNAITAVSSYNGTTPAKVFNALSTHFHGATSNAFATWINVNLRYLSGVTWVAGYQCFDAGMVESTWACRGSSELATTFWCVPGIDIRLCPPYFNEGDIARSKTMIHEWIHKYGCNFDMGYEWESDYPQHWTVSQLLNADSFASFIRDVQ